MADNTPRPDPQSVQYWLGFGAIFSILIFGLLIAAFLAPENTCDQWTLLRYVLPIFSGIAAGSFVGAISAQGHLHQLAVAATGGFAVWLITLVVVGVPERCKVPIISNFTSFENTSKEGAPGSQLPKTLDRKSGAYDTTQNDFAIFLAARIGNIYTGPRGMIDINVEVDGLDENQNVVWAEKDHFDNLDDWKNLDIAKKFTPEELVRRIGSHDTYGQFVMNWVIECFKNKELADWNGNVIVKVVDNKGEHKDTDYKTATKAVEQSLSLLPRQCPKTAANNL